MDFDSILPDVGSFGVYQKLVIAMLMPAVFPCAFHAYSQLFIASQSDHWCRIPELEPWVHDYPDIIKNLSIPIELRDGELKFSECKMYDRNYTEIARFLESSIASVELNQLKYSNEPIKKECEYGWNFDRKVFPNTVVMEWNLVCDRSYHTTFALVLFGVGGLIGNYIFGYLQDYWGRRPSFFAYLFLEIAACAISSFAWDYSSWLVCRILVGITVPAILASPYVLAIELVGPQHRVFCTIALNIAYSMGLVILAGVVYLVRDWRYLTLAVSLPLLLLYSCFFVLPESPRWLIATGNYKRAAKVMKTMAKFNGKTIPDNYADVLKQKLSRTPEIEVVVAEPDTDTENIPKYGVLDLFRTKNMRAKTLIITFIWFSNTAVYVGLSYYAPALGGDEIWNFFLAGAVELPTYLFLWPGLLYIGRRWILCSSMIIGGLACLGTFLVQNEQFFMLILYCIGKMGISSAFVVLPLAASELYPTVVRGLGMSVSSVIGMIGPIVIPLINHMGHNMLVLPIIIMGTLLTLGGIASLFLPETMGQPLPQTIEDGENVALTNPFKVNCKCCSTGNHHIHGKNSHICSICKIEMKNLK